MLELIPTYKFEFTLYKDDKIYKLIVSQDDLSSMFNILMINNLNTLNVQYEKLGI